MLDVLQATLPNPHNITLTFSLTFHPLNPLLPPILPQIFIVSLHTYISLSGVLTKFPSAAPHPASFAISAICFRLTAL